MIHIMMDINEHQDQRYTRGDNNGRDLYLLGVNVLVLRHCNEHVVRLGFLNIQQIIGSILMIYIMMVINEHQDQKYTWVTMLDATYIY